MAYNGNVFYDGKEPHTFTQSVLEKIGIRISECNFCKEIHFMAIPERKTSWKIKTANPELVRHLQFVTRFGDCPNDMPAVSSIEDI